MWWVEGGFWAWRRVRGDGGWGLGVWAKSEGVGVDEVER